jgi:alkylhydroperoxidase family enzyme
VPVIEPVPWPELDPELQELIDAGTQTGMLSTTIPPQIWAYRAGIAKQQLRLYAEFFERGILSSRVMELVRLRIASLNDCEACKVARKSKEVSEEDIACLASDDPRFTQPERAALRFAELFAVDHFSLDESVFTELARHYSNEEIVELGLYAALMLGNGRLAYVLRAYGTDEHEALLHYHSPSSTAV